MKKKLIYIVPTVIAVLILLVVWRKHSAAAAEKATEFETAQVTRGTFVKTVQCTGRVVSNLDVEIKCKASGLVVNMPFDVSDTVKKDDLLIEIDPADQIRNVQQAEASLAAAKAKLGQAEENVSATEISLSSEKKRTAAVRQAASSKAKDAGTKAKREKELLARKQSSVEEAETAQTQADQAAQDLQSAEAQVEACQGTEHQLAMRRHEVDLAKAQLQNDEIALALAKQRLVETKVYSPIDGVVASRTVQVGQIVASGINNVGGGTTVLTLSDLSRIFVLAAVDESDIGQVALDQAVNITADAYPGETYSGKVVRVASKGVNTSNVVTFEVRIEVLSENRSHLRPEMTANVEITIAEKPDSLMIPVRAVSRREGRGLVSVKQPDGAVKDEVPVEIGISNGSEIEVFSGVSEGDTLVFPKEETEGVWRAKAPGPMGRRPGGRR